MVEASITLLNIIVIPSLRLTGTPTDPFAGMVDFTWGGVLSGGGSGPSRPHAVGNDATTRTTANRIDGFFIPFTLFTYAREALPMDMHQMIRKMLA
jgi:hypothetical protein